MKWTPNGEISTVGLFYSQGEAEKIVTRLQSIPEKADRRYDIVAAGTRSDIAISSSR